MRIPVMILWDVGRAFIVWGAGRMPAVNLWRCSKPVLAKAKKTMRKQCWKALDVSILLKKRRKNELTPDQIVELRQEKSKPVLDDLALRLNALQSQTPPKRLLGKAVNYTLKN